MFVASDSSQGLMMFLATGAENFVSMPSSFGASKAEKAHWSAAVGEARLELQLRSSVAASGPRRLGRFAPILAALTPISCLAAAGRALAPAT